jgi:acetolactate synthase-1/2/3 large subunit
MKVHEYITRYLVSKNINQCFSVTGGFAMYLNDSFGDKLKVIYTHGENPAGYSALGWSSVNHEPSVCCVTAGCGATNAVTPCLIAYQDSVPVFFISGQVHKDENVHGMNNSMRTYFGSDCDIVAMIQNVTKYAVELRDPSRTKEVLDTCYRNLTTGRLGPVWLSVPVDVQNQDVPSEAEKVWKESTRPIVLAGNGIHMSHTTNKFTKFIKDHNVPYVVSFFGSDLGEGTYTGKVGLIGDRAGNFAIQNADLILCLGCRLSKSITGYNRSMFAREAKIVYVDTDESEFVDRKQVDICVHMDLNDFFDIGLPIKDSINPLWIEKNVHWKNIWGPSELPENNNTNCPYKFLNNFFIHKPADSIVVASSGSLYCVVWHMYRYKTGDRFITSGHGDMGYELPVAIGAAIQSNKRTFCMVGDGSLQLNVQELDTLKRTRAPVTVVVFNNGGYGAIQITQKTVFKREFGIDVNTDTERIAYAYNIAYAKVTDPGDLPQLITRDQQGPNIIEIFCTVQERFPKLSNKLNEDGTFKNMPYEQMYPFLDQEVLDREMFIKQLE